MISLVCSIFLAIDMGLGSIQLGAFDFCKLVWHAADALLHVVHRIEPDTGNELRILWALFYINQITDLALVVQW